MITPDKRGIVIDNQGEMLTESFYMSALHADYDVYQYNRLYLEQDLHFGDPEKGHYVLTYHTLSLFYGDEDTRTTIQCDYDKKLFTIKKDFDGTTSRDDGTGRDITNPNRKNARRRR